MWLLLARHGKAAHNVSYERFHAGDRRAFHHCPDADVPLVEEGWRQAGAAGERLRATGLRPDVVFVSPALRARQTWEAYGIAGIPVIFEDRLREQDGGEFDRLPWAETEAARRHYSEEAACGFDARPPGGESIREHHRRALAWLNEAQEWYPGATVLAVTHFGTIGLLARHCERLDLSRYLAERPERMKPGYGAVLGYVRTPDGTWSPDFAFTPSDHALSAGYQP